MSGKFSDFDSSKIGTTFKRTKVNYVVADQSNVYRILPPFGKLAAQNKIAQYWSVHYGFAYSSKNKKSIPITCGKVTKYENGKQIVTQRCPLCDKLEAMNNAVTALSATPENQAAVLTLKEKLKAMNLDKKYYLNVLTRENTVEVLKLSYKHYKALEAELKRLRDTMGRNAAGITGGLFLDFRKSGKGRDTTFSVTPFSIMTKDASGDLVSKFVGSDLNADTLAIIEKDAKELTELFRSFSVEDLLLVSKGDEATIQRLFSAPTQDEVEDDSGADEDDSAASVATTVAVQNAMDEALASTIKTAPAVTPAAPTQAAAAPTVQANAGTAPATGSAGVTTAATTNTPAADFGIHKKQLSVDEIIAQFQKGG